MQRDEKTTLGFYGVGVMGEALVNGALTAGIKSGDILFYEKREERAAEIATRYEIQSKSLEEVASLSDIVFIAVKPQDLGGLTESISPILKDDSLLVSFAAGKKTSFIEDRLQSDHPVIRVMPNTPLLIGKGAAALSAGAHATSEDLERVTKLLAPTSLVIQVDESMQDAVTAVSGSGPAYFFRFVEAMIEGGVQLGLSREDASTLTLQTIVGAAGMLVESGKSPTTLRENVTSPNGTTAAALNVFENGGLASLISEAMRAARDRSLELG